MALPYTTARSGRPYRNNGATIPRAGAIESNSPITNAPDNVTQGYASRGVGGTTIVDTGATEKAVSSGTFARNMVAGQFVMMRYGFIGGSSTNFLNSGAADFGRRSIHYKEGIRTRKVVTAGWNYVTGQPLTTPSMSNDSFGQDDAARPTRAIPGEFVFTDRGLAKSGALAVPLVTDYPAKTN